MSVGAIGNAGIPLALPDRDLTSEQAGEPGRAFQEGLKQRPTRIAPRVDPSRVTPEMRRAAEGMEAMFLDQLFRVMRTTVPKGEGSLESPATEIYRSMLDSETAQRSARAGGVGLSEQIIAYLQSQSYTQEREKIPAAPMGGGDQAPVP